MNIQVLCIGHACHDLCMIVDGYPVENAKAETRELIESGGGPAANAAALLAMWGTPTALAALVGDDAYGRRVVDDLNACGVDTSLVELRADHATPVSFIVSNSSNGSRTIINRKAPSAALTLASLTLRPRLLLFDGHELGASLQAMALFPDAVTVLDAGSVREGTLELAKHVGYLVCSERFARQLTGVEDVNENTNACLDHLRTTNSGVIVITLGEHGCVVDDGERRFRMEAMTFEAVDTTGAGDVFHGAFCHALLYGLDCEASLRLATVAAGLSVRVHGGRPSIPSLAAVTAMI